MGNRRRLGRAGMEEQGGCFQNVGRGGRGESQNELIRKSGLTGKEDGIGTEISWRSGMGRGSENREGG